MHFHQVEVDDEVFQFVKAHAEPLVDSFNSALRRLLSVTRSTTRGRASGSEGSSKEASSLLPAVPSGMPQALRQILEVVHLVRSGAYSRTGATQFVAKQHRVEPQTVLDKYGRQLQLTASGFDRLLEQADLADLRRLLKSKFSEHSEVIDQFIG